ncbi:MAG: efflux RND transporter periplasmic adaptor subunit [Balneolia bacterium]|nr:efflux RND transporter periplasmic adaptor subunit [Balneolia bacterium]
MQNKTTEQEKSTRLKKLWADPSLRKKTVALFLIVMAALLIYPKLAPVINQISLIGAEDPEPKPTPVQATIVTESQVSDEIRANGTIRALQNINLSSEGSGIVTGIYFEEGSEVERGDLLVKINDTELQAELRRAEFSLQLMRETEKRQQQLFEGGGVSQEEYDAVLNQLNILESEVDLIQSQIDKTEIRAPFDGRVGLRYVDEGSYISPNTQIATLQNMSQMNIDFSVPERYAPRVNPGNQVSFTIQGVDSTFAGEVYAVEPRIDTRTRTLQIRARTDNENGMLRPGGFADINLTLGSFDNTLLVPSIALIPRSRSYSVLVYSGGVAEERPVETGVRTSNMVQISSGLAPGDTVLTTGLLQVQPGMPVELTQIEMPANPDYRAIQ